MHIEAIREITRSILAHKVTDKQLSVKAGVNAKDGTFKLEIWWKKGAPLGVFRRGLLKALENKIDAHRLKRNSLAFEDARNVLRISCLTNRAKNGGFAISVISDGWDSQDKIGQLREVERAVRSVREEFNDVLGQTKRTRV